MGQSIISEGKTTSEAIQKGLNKLKLSKKDVDIKVIEEETKKSFFNILAPRVVKVELTVREKIERKEQENSNKNSNYKKDNNYESNKCEKSNYEKNNYKTNNYHNEDNNIKDKNSNEDDVINEENFSIIKDNLEEFLKEFFKKLKLENIEYKIINQVNSIKVDIKGENLNPLIGYRGETLNALQILISRIGNKGLENRYRIIVDIAGYRDKRIKSLEDLAIKVSKTVEKNKKSITLEPMSAFERKIIHNKLQKNTKVTTRSIGSEPNRKIVIELK